MEIRTVSYFLLGFYMVSRMVPESGAVQVGLEIALQHSRRARALFFSSGFDLAGHTLVVCDWGNHRLREVVFGLGSRGPSRLEPFLRLGLCGAHS